MEIESAVELTFDSSEQAFGGFNFTWCGRAGRIALVSGEYPTLEVSYEGWSEPLYLVETESDRVDVVNMMFDPEQRNDIIAQALAYES